MGSAVSTQCAVGRLYSTQSAWRIQAAELGLTGTDETERRATWCAEALPGSDSIHHSGEPVDMRDPLGLGPPEQWNLEPVDAQFGEPLQLGHH